MENKTKELSLRNELVRIVKCFRRWRGCFKGNAIDFVSKGCYFLDNGRYRQRNIEGLWGVINSHEARKEYVSEEDGFFHRVNEDGVHFIYNTEVREDLQRYQEERDRLELAKYYPRDTGSSFDNK